MESRNQQGEPVAGQRAVNDLGEQCICTAACRDVRKDGEYEWVEYEVIGRGKGHSCTPGTWRMWASGLTRMGLVNPVKIAEPPASSTDILTSVRESIDRALSGSATGDDILTTINVVDKLKQLVRDLASKAEDACVAWLLANGDLECGEIRYYAGVNKTTQCVDNERAINAILCAASGDISKLAMCLSSNAIKPGACRELLPPDEFDGLFVTKETNDLKTGKPVKRVQKADGRFSGKRIKPAEQAGPGTAEADAF